MPRLSDVLKNRPVRQAAVLGQQPAAGGAPRIDASDLQQHRESMAAGGMAAAATARGTAVAAADASAAPPPAAATAAAASDAAAAAEAALARLKQLHERRLRERGPRVYRHPDGLLRAEPPAPEPLVVVSALSALLLDAGGRSRTGSGWTASLPLNASASSCLLLLASSFNPAPPKTKAARRRWAPLVDHCRAEAAAAAVAAGGGLAAAWLRPAEALAAVGAQRAGGLVLAVGE